MSPALGPLRFAEPSPWSTLFLRPAASNPRSDRCILRRRLQSARPSLWAWFFRLVSTFSFRCAQQIIGVRPSRPQQHPQGRAPGSPFKNGFCRNSRGNEAHFPSKSAIFREPPYVGCYFFKSPARTAPNRVAGVRCCARGRAYPFSAPTENSPGARDLSRRNDGKADPRLEISRPRRQPIFLRTKVRAPF